MLGEIIVMLYYFRVCSSLLSCGSYKHHDQKQLVVGSVFVNLHFSRSQSIIERSQDRNSSRMLLTVHSGSCLASFLVWPRPACLGMALPTVGWALSRQSLATGQSDGGNSLVEVLSFQVSLGCQVYRRN